MRAVLINIGIILAIALAYYIDFFRLVYHKVRFLGVTRFGNCGFADCF